MDYQTWLREMGAGDDRAAQCIYYQVFRVGKNRMISYDVIYQTFNDFWIPTTHMKESIRGWKSTTYNIDVLQMAVLCSTKRKVKAIVENVMFYHNYAGTPGLVNHPAHLAFHLGNADALKRLLPLLEDLPQEKWTVTLTSSPGPRKHPRFVVRLPSGQCYDSHPLSLSSKHCLGLLYNYYSKLALQKPHQVTTFFIELMWDMLKMLCQTMTWELHDKILMDVAHDFHSAIPFYQLAGTLEWEDPIMSAFGILEAVYSLQNDQVRFVLSWLRRDQLRHVAKSAVNRMSAGQVPRRAQEIMKRARLEAIIEMVEKEERDKSLKQECMVVVLRTLGGFVPGVLGLPIPRPLQCEFLVPFYDDYEKLCKASSM